MHIPTRTKRYGKSKVLEAPLRKDTDTATGSKRNISGPKIRSLMDASLKLRRMLALYYSMQAEDRGIDTTSGGSAKLRGVWLSQNARTVECFEVE